MDVGAIDTSATQGTSWLHRTSATAKLVAFGFVIAAVVVTWNALAIAALAIALSAVMLSTRVSVRLALGLAAYGALLAAVFALASAPDWLAGTVIVLKAFCAALASVLLALTTPYPQIFAPIQRVVPGVAGDALLMTYRTSFLMLEKSTDVLRAIRLRAGVRGRGGLRAIATTAQALGGVALYSLDLAQREYDVLRLRGYSGRLRARLPKSRSRLGDVVAVGGAVLALLAAVLWRVGWQTLNPYSWLLVIPAFAAVALALVVRWRNR